MLAPSTASGTAVRKISAIAMAKARPVLIWIAPPLGAIIAANAVSSAAVPAAMWIISRIMRIVSIIYRIVQLREIMPGP